MRKSFTLIELLVCIAIIIVLLALLPEVYPPVSLLLLGWVGFLRRVVPRLNPDVPTVIAALVALALFTLGVHWLGRRNAGTSTAPRWTWRRSVAPTALVFVLFAAGVAIVGLTHMSYWLATSPEPIRFTREGIGSARSYSQNNLKQMGLAAHNYHDQSMSLPVAGTFSDDGRALHGWETPLLPFLEQSVLYGRIDMRYAWNDALNAPHFKTDIYTFRHPRFFQEKQDEQGFALIHYAANSHLIRAGKTKFPDVTDGAANTIMMGEINSHFPAWGKPMNVRDPGLGVNRSPRGFGGPPGAGGASFVFVDGHVAFISEKVSPGLMRALATPAGGEPVNPDALDR